MTIREYLKEHGVEDLKSARKAGLRFISIEWYCDVYDARRSEDPLLDEEVRAVRDNIIYV